MAVIKITAERPSLPPIIKIKNKIFKVNNIVR